jgi:putative hydrolase of the HAD superfamily
MKASPPLKAIFFDIDDTLFSTTVFAERARRNAVRAMINTGINMPLGKLLAELKEVIVEFSSNHGQHFDKLLQRIPESTFKGINPAVLVASGIVAYHQTKVDELEPFPDAAAALRKLNATPLLLGVITAGRATKQAEKIIRLGLYPYFAPMAIFISDQIGISKPNVKLFLRACECTGLSPQETMYVGNDPVKDIDPANSIGMVTVHSVREKPRVEKQAITRGDYEISDFHELLKIMRDDFDIHVDP